MERQKQNHLQDQDEGREGGRGGERKEKLFIISINVLAIYSTEHLIIKFH